SGSGIRTISASSPLLPGQLLPPARAQGAFPSSPRQHASTVVGMKRQRHSPLLEGCCLLLPSLWLLLIIHPPTGQGCPASILKTVDRRPLLSSRPSPSPDDKGGPSPTRSALQRVRVRHSRFLLPPLFPPPSVFAGHLRQLWRRFTHIFHKEIEALTEADPREENILELIRTLPEAVSEGHHETVHSLKRGWAALQHKALEGLLVGWGG
ncbi:hypothetical protein NGA_0403800, partial [Nannochloropsis gaditana CCMP526]|uniref:uncharacterized protein n=1 Tax=Nannochloropsis gaditana (strain CCMP526) TaxID=1093141 RepID=UPI00029F7F47